MRPACLRLHACELHCLDLRPQRVGGAAWFPPPQALLFLRGGWAVYPKGCSITVCGLSELGSGKQRKAKSKQEVGQPCSLCAWRQGSDGWALQA